MKISQNEEKFYEKLFDSYSQNTKYPSEEELSCVELSQEFEEKMHRLIKGEKPFKVHTSKKVIQAVASFVVVLALIAGGFAVGTFAELSEPEMTVKEVIELHNSVMYKTELVRSCYYDLSYIPEGYTESRGLEIGSSEGYSNEKGEGIWLIQYMDEIPIPEIDRFADVYEKIDGGLYVLNTGTGSSRYIWSDLGYVFELRADNCSKEELFKMRDSLVIG